MSEKTANNEDSGHDCRVVFHPIQLRALRHLLALLNRVPPDDWLAVYSAACEQAGVPPPLAYPALVDPPLYSTHPAYSAYSAYSAHSAYLPHLSHLPSASTQDPLDVLDAPSAPRILPTQSSAQERQTRIQPQQTPDFVYLEWRTCAGVLGNWYVRASGEDQPRILGRPDGPDDE
jgi:hypothetical protein